MPIDTDQFDAILRKETNFGTLDLSNYPRAIATEVFEDPLTFTTIQITKLGSQLSNTRWRYGPIAVRLNSDPSANARAIPRRDGSVICINAGTCVRLRQLFTFAVCDEQVFPSIKKEKPFRDIETLRFGLDPTIVLKNADLSPRKLPASENDCVHLAAPLPPTRSRQALAKCLTIAAIDFISMHEFAHLSRKHIERLKHLKYKSFCRMWRG